MKKNNLYANPTSYRKKFFAAFALLFLLTSILPGLYAQEKSGEKIKRRVLILDFVNAGKTRGGEYLDLTIPDALIEHLQKTDNFIILRRDLATQKAKQIMNKQHALSVEKAIKVGDAASADIVVMGNYAVYDNFIQIQAKAIDVHSGEVPVVMSENGQLDRNLFVSIQRLTRVMASKMSERLGPMDPKELPAKRAMYEQKRALNEKSKNRMMPSLTLGFMGVVGITTKAQALEFGRGLRIGWTPTPLFHAILTPYFEWNVWWSADRFLGTKLFFNGIFAGFTYPIELFPKFVVSPFFLGGVYGGHVGAKNIFFLGANKIGVDLKYVVKNDIGVNVTFDMLSMKDDGTQIALEFSAGAAKKF